MATFSMDDLRKLAGHDETVTIPSQPQKLTRTKEAVGQVKRFQHHRSRTETETLIKSILAEAKRPCTFREIAYGLERNATPHLRGILVEMAQAGDLVESEDMHPSRRLTRLTLRSPCFSRRHTAATLSGSVGQTVMVLNRSTIAGKSGSCSSPIICSPKITAHWYRRIMHRLQAQARP